MLTILGVLIAITVLLASYFITCNRFAQKEAIEYKGWKL